MRVVIKIECDTINELATHLNVIKSQIKKEAKNCFELNSPLGKFKQDCSLFWPQ